MEQEKDFEQQKKDFLASIEYQILENADSAHSFSAIIDSRGPIVIK